MTHNYSNPSNTIGFIRDNAALVIIIVSDEDDHSFGNVQYFTRMLNSIKGAGNSNLVTLSAIIGMPVNNEMNLQNPEGCVREEEKHIAWAGASAGIRYFKAAKLTGGVVASICSEDFNLVLSSLGITAAGLIRVFPLSRKPIVATISVKVNEHTIEKNEDLGWIYNEESNSIIFKGRFVPESKAEVIIEYNMR